MKDPISKKQLREFGLLIGFGFPFFIGWFLPMVIGHGFRSWTIWIGAIGSVFGLFAPQLLKYPYKIWMLFGHVLGWFNSHIILGLVFILLLQPIAFIMRLFGYDPLRTKLGGKSSYRENRKNQITDLTRIF